MKARAADVLKVIDEIICLGLTKEAFDYGPLPKSGDYIIPDDPSRLEVL